MAKDKAQRARVNRWGCTLNGVKRYARGGGLARASPHAHAAVDRLLEGIYTKGLRYAATRSACAGLASVPLQFVVEGIAVTSGLNIVGIRPKRSRQTRKAKEEVPEDLAVTPQKTSQ